MNIFAAAMQTEKEPIGTQTWFSTVVPLVQLQFPEGTEFSPTMSCSEFLQKVMDLPPTVRSRILSTEIVEQQEEIEKVKRVGYKTMLVAVVMVILIASVIMTGGYVAMTAFDGKAMDKAVLDDLFKFVFELIKAMASIAGVDLGSAA